MIDAIIIDSRPDCQDFQALYHNLDGTILINPSNRQIHSLLFHSRNPLLISGHGNEDGPFSQDWERYAISRSDIRLLRLRPIIGVWCYAGNFADTYQLHGFFTSMFISNMDEANMLMMNDATPELIREQNILFSQRLNALMLSDTPMDQWADILKSNVNADSPDFVRYNYEAMSNF